MMFHSRAARTTILATGSALALMTAALGERAQAESNGALAKSSFGRARPGVGRFVPATKSPAEAGQVGP
jgi:hypothetical protein